MTAALCLDSETALIVPGRQAPPLVCVSWADDSDVGLEHRTDAKSRVKKALDSDLILTAHNAAFDFAVFCAEWPDLMPQIFDVYESDRITCTRIRERLNHIALGVLGKFERVDGGFVHLGYSLEDCTRRHLGFQLEKDEWRLRYGELIDVPLTFWPQGAKDYAMNDALAGYGVYARQEEDPRYLEDQYRQSRAQFWLYLMRAWGVHTDPEGVREFARRIQREYDEIAQDMIAFGLMRMDRKTGRPGSRNVKAVQQRVIAAYAAIGVDVFDEENELLTGGGKTGNKQVKTDADVCERSRDPILKKYADLSSLKKTLSSDIPLLLEGITTPIHPGYEVLVQSGRTACHADEQDRGGNLQNLPTEIKWKKDVAGKPVFDERGRCIITDGGMRECFVPREGKLFAIGDYSAFELRTWAQVCLKVLGQSRMAEVLNTPNADPHCEIACRILKIPYAEAYADYKQNPNGRVYLPRQTGKCVNFGKPGGLGAERLVDYARKNYNVIISLEEAYELSDFWKESWPESGPWFDWIDAQTSAATPVIKQLFSNRYRGNVGFTDAANSFFQGLAADAMKAAGFLIAKACYVDQNSVLFGARPVLTVHDEFVVEVDDDQYAAEATEELAHLMIKGASPFLPDVPPEVEPLLARRWSKAAKPVRDANNRLIPWDLPRRDP